MISSHTSDNDIEYARMRTILEEMVGAVESKNQNYFIELNKEFEELMPKLDYTSDIDRDYDNCRQSCLFSLNDFAGDGSLCETFLDDAKSRLEKIAKNEMK